MAQITVIACYLGLYEEGEVEHISDVRPSFLDVGCPVIFVHVTHMVEYACTTNTYKCRLMVIPSAFLIVSICVKKRRNGWVGPLICLTSRSSYNPI